LISGIHVFSSLKTKDTPASPLLLLSRTPGNVKINSISIAQEFRRLLHIQELLPDVAPKSIASFNPDKIQKQNAGFNPDKMQKPDI